MTQVLLTDRTVAPAIRERIEVVHGAGETMRALVDDILDVAKIESGEMTVSRERVNLVAILQDAERLWGAQASAKGLELVLRAEDVPNPIMSDGGRLRQVIFNLLSNAVKFTPSGQIRVEAGVFGEDRAKLEIRVADSGIGIPAASLEEIFEPFRQVQGGMTRQYSGTGLGLAICRRLVAALGGVLTVESVENEGSTFTITLPLEAADHSANTEPGTTAEPTEGLAEARLLIVEENAKTLGVLSILLAPHAASIARAKSLDEAAEVMADATHLLVSTGTAGTGLGALGTLVQAAHGSAARVTLLHCVTEEASAADVMMLGADQLIIKPVNAADLLGALQSLYGEDPESFVAPSLLASTAA